jgi:hypothetical protein
LVNLVERHRAVPEQVEQGLALFGKAEAAGQQLDGSDIRAADGRYDFLHQSFVPSEAMNDPAEEKQMLIIDTIRRPVAHDQPSSTRPTAIASPVRREPHHFNCFGVRRQ